MTRRKTKVQRTDNSIAVAKIGIIAAVITAVATIAMAVFGYLSARSKVEIPIRATQAAESRSVGIYTPQAGFTNSEICNSSDLEHNSFILEQLARVGGSRGNLRVDLSVSSVAFYVYQEFEHGYMLWSDESILDDKSITVLFPGSSVVTSGDWKLYNDLWHDPTPELPAILTPPGPGLVQPIRGFGNLWFGKNEVKSNLGWGIMDEIDVDALVWRFEVGWDSWLILCIKGIYSPEVKNPSDYLGITFALIQFHDEEIGTGFWRRLDQ